MKNFLLCLTFISVFISCTEESDDNTTPLGGNPNEYYELISERGMIEYIGSIEMEDGPHDLLIHGSHLFAVRDHKIFQFNIQNPASPILQNQYALSNTSGRFGKLYVTDNKLYVPCQTDGFLYEFNSNLSLIKKHDLALSYLNPNVSLKDVQGNFWVGGSNGSSGILAKYTVLGDELILDSHWISESYESMIESIVEKNGYIIASIPSGDLLSFNKANLSAGVVNSVTFQHESGHEKWGHTLIKVGEKAFWANWGAGFATVNISNPSTMSVSHVLTNSGFKAQFPNAEGTNVYDVAYNSSKNILCVANGWSGLFLVKPESPDQVLDYIDLEYFQNRCIETTGNYVYTGNISGGMSGDLKGLKIYKLNF